MYRCPALLDLTEQSIDLDSGLPYWTQLYWVNVCKIALAYESEPTPPAGVGDCGTAEAKGKQKERGVSKVEARRCRYALSSYTSLLDNTAILVYGPRKLCKGGGQQYRNCGDDYDWRSHLLH